MQAQQLKSAIIETITLQSPKGRLTFLAVVTIVVFLVPFAWLENLSLWKNIGWESAPSIGLTRAYWLLLHGDPAGAWERNSLIYLVLVVVVTIVIADITKLRRQRKEAEKED